MEQTDLLILGRNENGRRPASTSILGTDAFHVDIDCEIAEYKNRKIKVVDCPCVGDNTLDTLDEINEFAEWMTKAMEMNSREGFSAIVLVLKYGNNSMREELEGCEALKRIFHEDILSNHGILLMTGGDNFDREAHRSGLSFEDWCDKQGGSLASLLDEFGGRIVLFDNFTEDNGKKDGQVDRLLELVEGLPSGGEMFTNDLLQRAGDERRKALDDSDTPVLSDVFTDEISLIIQKYEELKQLEEMEDTDLEMDEWAELSTRTEGLVNHMMTESAETALQKYVLKFEKALREFVDCEACSKKERKKAGKKLFEKAEKLDNVYMEEKSGRICRICDCIEWTECSVVQAVASLI